MSSIDAGTGTSAASPAAAASYTLLRPAQAMSDELKARGLNRRHDGEEGMMDWDWTRLELRLADEVGAAISVGAALYNMLVLAHRGTGAVEVWDVDARRCVLTIAADGQQRGPVIACTPAQHTAAATASATDTSSAAAPGRGSLVGHFLCVNQSSKSVEEYAITIPTSGPGSTAAQSPSLRAVSCTPLGPSLALRNPGVTLDKIALLHDGRLALMADERLTIWSVSAAAAAAAAAAIPAPRWSSPIVASAAQDFLEVAPGQLLVTCSVGSGGGSLFRLDVTGAKPTSVEVSGVPVAKHRVGIRGHAIVPLPPHTERALKPSSAAAPATSAAAADRPPTAAEVQRWWNDAGPEGAHFREAVARARASMPLASASRGTSASAAAAAAAGDSSPFVPRALVSFEECASGASQLGVVELSGGGRAGRPLQLVCAAAMRIQAESQFEHGDLIVLTLPPGPETGSTDDADSCWILGRKLSGELRAWRLTGSTLQQPARLGWLHAAAAGAHTTAALLLWAPGLLLLQCLDGEVRLVPYGRAQMQVDTEAEVAAKAALDARAAARHPYDSDDD